jgi:hypothetical protein
MSDYSDINGCCSDGGHEPFRLTIVRQDFLRILMSTKYGVFGPLDLH